MNLKLLLFLTILADNDFGKKYKSVLFTVSHRLQTLELENKSLREEAVRCRSQTDKLRTEKTGVEDQLSEAKCVISSLQEEVTLLSDQERRQKECVQANQQVRVLMW